MPVEGVEPTRGLKPQRILNPILRSDQRISDNDLQQPPEKLTNQLTNPIDILAQLPGPERTEAIAELLAAWRIPDATAGRIVGLLEAAIEAAQDQGT